MIIVRRIPHWEQRYDTCGDWFTDEVQNLQFRVSAMADWRSEAAVFLHEFVEAMLCRQAGITEEQVDAWDLAHRDAEEPGELPACPYRAQHAAATDLETLLVDLLGLRWHQHVRIVADACKDYPRKVEVSATGSPAAHE